MILTIDIGNTNINFGYFRGKKILKRFSIPTHTYGRKALKKEIGAYETEAAILCSVVPRLTGLLCSDIKVLCAKPVYIVGKHITPPIVNRYRDPAQVGKDRLVNAYAASELFKAPLIVVDFGTAVTFDVLSKDKEYLGGMILPGLSISFDCLARRTALLPRVVLSGPEEFIGTDTKSSMKSGVVYGIAAVTDRLTEEIKERIGKNAKVIGTGGDIDLVRRYCGAFDAIDKDLTLKGLYLIYRNRAAGSRPHASRA